MLNNIFVSNTTVADRKPFIYFIAILSPVPLLYVGQTCQRQGVLGRLLQHLDTNGTLRVRAIEAGIDEFQNVEIITLDLSDYLMFGDIHNRHREALEYLLHCEMKAQGCKTRIPFEVISYVRANRLTYDFDLQRMAKELVHEVVYKLPFN